MSPSQFPIAAARGALDAGRGAVAATLLASLAGEALAACADMGMAARIALVVLGSLAGLRALWLLARIEIDRRLFAALERAADEAGEAGEAAALARLDETLLALRWIDAGRAGRPLALRVQGAVGLLRQAMIVAFAQWGVLGIAVALGVWQ
ncbi:MAG: hypothetical protein V4764_18105 [Burkholderia sp.]